MALKEFNILNENEYDNYSLETIKEELNRLNASNKYNDCIFENNIWCIFDPSTNVVITYNFEKLDTLDNFKVIFNREVDLFNIIKCWCATSFNYYAYTTVKIGLNNLIQFINLTKGFDKFYEEQIDSLLESYSDYYKESLVRAILNINDYFEDLINENVIIYFSKYYIRRKYNSREIPSTKFLLLFNQKITETEKNNELLEHHEMLLHTLIKIWWGLTMFIPIRPVEFAKLTKENFIPNKEGVVYLEIVRNKNKVTKQPIRTKVKISKEIFKMIEFYIEESAAYGVSSTIFNYNSLSVRKRRKQIVSEKFNTQNLHYALGKYVDLVFNNHEKELYKLDLDLFTPIITRHLAFINLKRQGYNPFEITYLGGHSKVTTQEHYFNHVQNLIDAELLSIFNYIKLDSNKTSLELISEFNKQIINEKEATKFIDLTNGYCADIEMNCPTNSCFDCCNWRVTKEQLMNIQKEISIHKNNKINQIKSTLNEMTKIYSYWYKKVNTKDVMIDNYSDKKLKVSANKLDELINHLFLLQKLENQGGRLY